MVVVVTFKSSFACSYGPYSLYTPIIMYVHVYSAVHACRMSSIAESTKSMTILYFSAVDARMFTLPNGSPIYVFVREGLVYIPNPELAKILPAISRTAMENIRNSYGITVYQVSGLLTSLARPSVIQTFHVPTHALSRID